MSNQAEFDVFLAHNSLDKPQVKIIADQLKQRGLKVWIDEEQIPPGRSFQDVIQQAIPNVKAAAIFLGCAGLGRWQTLELQTFTSRCVRYNIPVIPVLLPGVNKIPDDLLFLQELNWVNFIEGVKDSNALYRLEWGITQQKPQISPNEEILSASDEDINYYTQLDNYLSQAKWQEADQETKKILLFSSGKNSDEKLGVEEIRNLPDEILFKINELWVKHSNQHFGFSIQQSICQNISSPKPKFNFIFFKKTQIDENPKDSWYSFGRCVGWYQTNNKTGKDEWIQYKNLVFTLNAPKGSLPYFRDWWKGMRYQFEADRFLALMDRIKNFTK